VATSPAPAAPANLRAILVSPLSPANQVNLLWRVGAEPDVVAYDIYRTSNAVFLPGEASRIAELKVEEATRRYDHQMFLDTTVAPDTTYYYRVRARNANGKAGAFSAIAAVTTKTTIHRETTAPTKRKKPHIGDDIVPAIP
jgi:hypothetical protein